MNNQATDFALCGDNKNGVCIYIRGEINETLEFAAKELKRYIYRTCGIELPVMTCGAETGRASIVLCIDSPVDTETVEFDRFSIGVADGILTISGVNSRSVLYGVYKFLDEYLGIKWLSPGYEFIPAQKSTPMHINHKEYKASFQDRGFVLEDPKTVEYVLKLIDWTAKNCCNSIFFTFDLWEKHKDTIRTEICKRDLKLTLGGHNINTFFPAKEYFEDNPDWFSLYNGNRIDKQPCYTNAEGIKVITENIVRYCMEEPLINTLSIWPNDNSYVCRCSSCTNKGFIKSFIDFLENVKSELKNRGVNIGIQHIAYNSQLSWDMLETIPEENKLDTLIACWGRNYKFSMQQEAAGAYDVRFKKVLLDWADACNNKFGTALHVFEYYSDYWMLGSLFPPLIKNISKDISLYKDIGVRGVFSLILPYEKSLRIKQEGILHKSLPDNYEHYEFDSENSAMWPNLYAFARKTWNSDMVYEEIMKDYCKGCYGGYSSLAKEIFEILEENIAGLSEYSTKFFGLRFIDVWHRDSWTKTKSIASKVEKWNPDTDDISIPVDRARSCSKILGNIEPFHTKIAGNGMEYEQHNSIFDLVGYFNFIVLKLKSIYHQSLAQIDIMEEKYGDAEKNLVEALRIEHGINGWDKKDCEYWLELVRSRN